MGLFKRVGDIISANLNEMVDRFEEPEQMLALAIVEMEAAVASALDGAVKVIANERLLARQLDDNRKQVERCRNRAAEEVRAGNDDAARRALSRKADYEKLTAALADQHEAAELSARRLRIQIEALRVRLREARRKQVTLIARNRAADARRRLSRSIDGVAIDDSAFNKFDRVARKIEQAEAETDALVELTMGRDGDDEVDRGNDDVEAELAALKQNLSVAGCSG